MEYHYRSVVFEWIILRGINEQLSAIVSITLLKIFSLVRYSRIKQDQFHIHLHNNFVHNSKYYNNVNSIIWDSKNTIIFRATLYFHEMCKDFTNIKP